MEVGFILASGRSVRMGPIASPCNRHAIAKAVAPLGLNRLIDYSLGALRRGGIQRIWCDLFWLPDTVRDYLNGGSRGAKPGILCGERLHGLYGSILRMAEASHLSDDDTVVVLCCDIVHDLDLRPVIEQHRQSQAAMTMVVNPVWNRGEIERYGTTALEGMRQAHEFQDYGHYVTYLINYTQAQGGRALRVEGFTEKKPWDQTMSLLNDSSIYVLSGRVIKDYHPNREFPSINCDLVPWLLNHPKEYPLFGFVMPFEQEGRGIFWRDVATEYDLWKANMDRLKGTIDDPFGLKGKTSARIAKSAMVCRSILGKGVVVGKGVEVADSVVGNGVVIEKESLVCKSVLFPRSFGEREPNRLGAGSVLLESMFLGGRVERGITAKRKIVYTAVNGETRIEPLAPRRGRK